MWIHKSRTLPRAAYGNECKGSFPKEVLFECSRCELLLKSERTSDRGLPTLLVESGERAAVGPLGNRDGAKRAGLRARSWRHGFHRLLRRLSLRHRRERRARPCPRGHCRCRKVLCRRKNGRPTFVGRLRIHGWRRLPGCVIDRNPAATWSRDSSNSQIWERRTKAWLSGDIASSWKLRLDLSFA